MNTTSKEGSLFELDGVPKLSQAFPLALQHVVATVSYTHLDVYKRQVQRNTVNQAA